MKFMSRHFLLLMPCLLALVGCADQLTKQRTEQLNSSKVAIEAAVPCCRSFDEVRFEKMSIPFDSEFVIDRSGPAYTFATGKSFFRAFELPQSESPYVLQIDSRMAGGGVTVYSAWMFYPALLFLDAQHNPIAAPRDLSFQFSAELMDTYGMTAKVPMDESAKQARYVIVYTEPRYLSRAFKFHAWGLSGSGTIIMPTASDTKAVPFNYEGRVGLRTFPYKSPP